MKLNFIGAERVPSCAYGDIRKIHDMSPTPVAMMSESMRLAQSRLPPRCLIGLFGLPGGIGGQV